MVSLTCLFVYGAFSLNTALFLELSIYNHLRYITKIIIKITNIITKVMKTIITIGLFCVGANAPLDRKACPWACQGNGRHLNQVTRGPGNGVIPRGHPKAGVVQWASSRVL